MRNRQDRQAFPRLIPILAVLGAGLACYVWYLRPYTIAPQATVYCHYMGYACGDCFPQYGIDSIADDSAATAHYKGLDLDIEWPDAQTERRFSDVTGIHVRNFQYAFTGKLMGYRHKDHLVIEVEQYRMDTLYEIWPDSLPAQINAGMQH